MNVVQLAIESLQPYTKNAKEHPKKQIEQVANSIKKFGWRQPLVVSKDLEVVVGHGRLLAAKSLKLKTVPCVVIDDLSEAEIRASGVAENKLNERDWDMGLVMEELRELTPELIELTGFDKLMETEEKDDIVPEVPEEPTSKVGDIYELGDHRVMCGDSTSEKDVAKLMNNNKADMVFTDPPYNVAYKGQGKNTSDGIFNDDMAGGDFDTFLTKVFKQYKDHTKTGAGNYVFHASRTQAQFEKAMAENGFEIKQQLIWNKPMAAMGWSDYRWKHEPFFYAGQKSQSIQFYGDRTKTTVWDFQKTEAELLKWAKQQKNAEQNGKTTVWSMKRDPVQDYVHPTQKPVEIVQNGILNSSKAGDIVMDLFLGSGSALIAAEKTGRVAYGMELDPKFVDVIVTRWCQFTDKTEIKKNGKVIEWEIPCENESEMSK